MKTPNTLTLALAALAGLSFATAYAAPSYTPNANSPINTTPLNSSSQNLNNYDDYIGIIDGYLTGTDTLLFPTPVGATFPKGPAYAAAVAAAAAANPLYVKEIVAAGAQYQPGNLAGKVKDILKLIGTNNPALAEAAVVGAIAGNPAKAADAASGAILGIIVSSAKSTADYGDIVDDAVTPATKLLIEKIAKAAVAATKKAPLASPTYAVNVAKAITTAVLADSVSDPLIKLYIDDVSRGLVAGAAGISGSSQAEVAAGALSILNGGAFENTKYVSEFASGALKAVKTDSTAYTDILAALKAEPTVGAGFTAQIDAVSAAHIALRTSPTVSVIADTQAALTATVAANVESFMIGAMQNKSSKSADLITAIFTDTDSGVLSNATKQAVVGAAVRGKFTNAAKVTTAAITASANPLSRSLTVAAAIPNATSDFAGVIAGAAVKTASVASNTATTADDQPDDVASAALSAAVAAGYGDAINDIAFQSVKAKKLEAQAIVQTLVKNADAAGWREAIVAAAVINDRKNKIAIKAGAAAGAAAAALSDFEKSSLIVTADLAEDAKTFNKSLFDDAIEDFYGPQVDVNGTLTDKSEFTKAILFARGGVNAKLAGPLLAVAMKFDTNASISSADMLAIAKSIYKKGSPALDIQYTVIQDALSQPDQLFDLVDHATATNLAKYAPDIAAAAVAARPEYAHIVARAGSSRSPANAGKIGAAAITYGHMLSNRDAGGVAIATPDDPAAVAAISAATILGIKDAKLIPTKESTAVKAAVGAMVKAAASVDAANLAHPPTGQVTTFRQSIGTSNSSFGNKAAISTAGSVTGIIAEIQGYGGSATNALDTLAGVAITAAMKADKKHSLEIAQAVGQAVQFVYQLNGGVGEIDTTFRNAIKAALTAGGATGNFSNALDFGITEAVANHYGAGAAGILNYAHRSGLLPAITSLENF